MLADSNTTSRNTFLKELSADYTILEAENGKKVLHYLKTYPDTIESVLYDLFLPGLDGYEFLALRNKSKELRNLPVFLFTDRHDQRQALRIANLKPTSIFFKPVDMNLLKAGLSSAIRPQGYRELPVSFEQVSNPISEELSLWGINPQAMRNGFALYSFTETNSSLLYVDQGLLSIGGVNTFTEFKKKYPNAYDLIKEENIESFQKNVKEAIEKHSSFSFSIEMKPNANHGSELFFQASWIPYEGYPNPVFIIVVIDSTQLFENQRQLCSLVEHDTLTGIYNQDTFYRKTEQMLRRNPDKEYLFIRCNIERFKAINELFGRASGDAILKNLASIFVSIIGLEGTFGRLYADHFALCIPQEGFDPDYLANVMEKQLNETSLKMHIRSAFGIYKIEDPTIAISLMNDRANMALKTATGNYRKPYAYYTDTLRKKLFKEQAIVNDMDKALASGDFKIFLQPFFNVRENRFTAAEALVRWIHPERGIIGPDSFIPIFEENGFIISLDLYIIEQVCKLQRHLLDENRPVVPISINLSRVDFYNQDLAKTIIAKIAQYNLPPALFMFEITESVYTENPNELLNTMKELQNQGFLILMDDFGSGYSSLNILKDVPIDILKLDILFSKEIGKSEKAENIIRSVVNMATLLKLPIVIEGIETSKQVDFYKQIGCEILQGYYFSRPLPINDFMNLDFIGTSGKWLEDMVPQRIEGFSLPQMQSRILKTLFSEIYLLDFTDDRFDLLYTNPNYVSVSADGTGMLSARLKQTCEKRVREQDRKQFMDFNSMENLNYIAQNGDSLSHEFFWLNQKGDYQKVRRTFIRLDNDRKKHLFLSCITPIENDCSDIAQRIPNHENTFENRYNLMQEMANIKVFEWDLKQNILYKSSGLELLEISKLSPLEIRNKQYANGCIHPDDLKNFEKTIDMLLSNSKIQGTTVRLKMINGKYRWYNLQFIVQNDLSDTPLRIIATIVDIDNKMRLNETVRLYRKQLDFITASAQWGILIGEYRETGEINFTFYNSQFYELLGYTKDEYEALGHDWLSRIEHKDAKKAFALLATHTPFSLTIKLTRKDGTVIDVLSEFSWYEQTEQKSYFLCNLFDLTKTKTFQQQIEHHKNAFFTLMDYLPSGFLNFEITNSEYTLVYANRTFDMLVNEAEAQKALLDEIKRIMSDLSHIPFMDLPVALKDTVLWVRITSFLSQNQAYVLINDISSLKETEKELDLERKRYRLLVENSVLLTFEYEAADDTGSCTFPTKSGTRGSIVYSNFIQDIMPKIMHPDSIAKFGEIVSSGMKAPTSSSFEMQVDFFETGYIWYLCNYLSIPDENGNIYKFMGTLVNIEKEKEAQANLITQKQLNKNLRKRAEFDAVSKLLNRATMEEKINDILSSSKTRWCFTITDLDNFKQINDTHGHQIGDTLIGEFATTLKQIFASPDAILGRFGGDEFIIFTPCSDKNQGIIETMDQFIQELSVVSKKLGLSHPELSSSSGIAFFPDQGTTFQELLYFADKALYQAKKQGKNQYSICSAT